MSDITERLKVAIADRYVIEREIPALKGGLGAVRRVLTDAVAGCPSRQVAARRAAPSRGFSPGTTRGGT